MKRKRFAVKEKSQLEGDNLKLYLGEDLAIVQHYRDKYREREEEKSRAAATLLQDLSLKSLGGRVLESKIYRIKSLSGCKKRKKKLSKLQPLLIDNDTEEAERENTNVIGNLYDCSKCDKLRHCITRIGDSRGGWKPEGMILRVISCPSCESNHLMVLVFRKS